MIYLLSPHIQIQKQLAVLNVVQIKDKDAHTWILIRTNKGLIIQFYNENLCLLLRKTPYLGVDDIVDDTPVSSDRVIICLKNKEEAAHMQAYFRQLIYSNHSNIIVRRLRTLSAMYSPNISKKHTLYED